MRKQNEEITFKGLLNIFLPKLWLILLVACICATAIGGYSEFMKKDTYTSNVSFVVVADTTSIPTSGGYDGLQSLVADYIYILNSRTFGELVAAEMSETYGNVTSAQIRAAMQIKKDEQANAICAYVKSTVPEFSKSAADAICRLAPDYVSKSCDYKVKIIPLDQPLLPETPDGKNVIRNAIIGFAGGMIATMLVVFMFSHFDVTVRSKEELERAFDIPVLGVIPRYDGQGEIDPDDTVGEFVVAETRIPAEEKVRIRSNQHPNVVDGRVVFDRNDR